MDQARNVIGPLFFVVFAVVAIGNLAIFGLPLSGALKQRIYTAMMVLVGLLFVGVGALTGNVAFALLMIPIMGLVIFANLRMIRFCHRCGAMEVERKR